MYSPAIQTACKALSLGKPGRAIVQLRDLWQLCPHPAVAELFDAIAMRLPPHPPILGGNKLAEHQSWLAIAREQDPGIDDLVMRWRL
jgi:hypothetical protein